MQINCQYARVRTLRQRELKCSEHTAALAEHPKKKRCSVNAREACLANLDQFFFPKKN